MVSDAVIGAATTSVIYFGMDYLLSSTNFPLYERNPSDPFISTIAGAGLFIFLNRQNKKLENSFNQSR